MQKNTIRRVSLLSLTLLASACGGGGGDDNNPLGNPASVGGSPAPIAELTESNADLVAFAALWRVTGTYNAVSAAAGASLLAAGFRLTEADLNNEGTSGSDPCEQSGSLDWAFGDADGDGEFSTGDSWHYQYNQCQDQNSQRDGTVDIRFVRLNGATPPAKDNLTEFEFSLQKTLYGSNNDIQGRFTFAVTSSDGITDTATLDIPMLTVSLGDEGSVTLNGITLVRTTNDNTNALSWSFSGDFNGPILGSFSVDTETELQALPKPGEDSPPLIGGYHQGVYTVSKGGRKLRLTAVDPDNVTIEIDVDGSPGYETSINATWADMGLKYYQYAGLL